MEAIKYLDKHLFKFLQFYINNYFTNSTAIFIASDHGENMISIHHLLNSDEFLYERTLGTFFLLLPKHYEKPKNEFTFEENLQIIDNEENDDGDDGEDEDEGYNWSENGFGWGKFAKKKKGYFIDSDYYHLNKKQTCLFDDLYNNKNKMNKKEEDKYSNDNIIKNDYNIFGST